MRDEQRQFLLDDFQEFVDHARVEARDMAKKRGDPHGPLPPDPYVEAFVRAIDWLRGQSPPSTELREFFEQRLCIFEREMNYQPIAFERDALAAAAEALR